MNPWTRVFTPLSALVLIVLLVGCAQQDQDKHVLKQKLNDLGDDIKYVKSRVTDFELELKVVKDEMKYLESLNGQQTAQVDPAQLKPLVDRLNQLEAQSSVINNNFQKMDKRIASAAKKTNDACQENCNAKNTDNRCSHYQQKNDDCQSSRAG